MKDNFRSALISMGYRQPDAELDSNKWAKPIGYNIFIAHEKELRLNIHYRVEGKDELQCWETLQLKSNTELSGDFASQIATIEQYTDCKRKNRERKTFAFISKAQQAEQICNKQ